jgi:hypothetical protein
VTVVTHKHDRVALLGEAQRLAVHLRHERAGRVDRLQLACLRVGVHAGGDAVRGEHAHRPLRHVGLALDEDHAALAQPLHDVLVVHDLLAHIHRRTVNLERPFDRLHGPIDACAVPARGREQDLFDRVGDGVGDGIGHSNIVEGLQVR